jgi:hypothetical protein
VSYSEAGWTAVAESLYLALVVITLDTLRAAHEHGYVINAYCRRCDRHAFLDLATLISVGQGERQIVGLRLRCIVCRGRGELSLIWPGRPSTQIS